MKRGPIIPLHIRQHILVVWCVAVALPLHATDVKVRVLRGVHVPMRDGVTLVADIYIPAAPGRYPTLMEMTPYLRTGHQAANLATPIGEDQKFWIRHGYVLVVADVRGRGDSDGEFDYFISDVNDGYDLIEWIATQPWSSGKVGMIGASYTGTNQWYAARNKPPHLACITPNSTAGEFFNEIPYQGGGVRLDWDLFWINSTAGRSYEVPLIFDTNDLLKHRPLITADEFAGRKLQLYKRFLSHPTFDDYWKRVQFNEADFRRIEIPSLAWTGWFDGTLPGTVFYYKNIKKFSPAADKQYLVIGPWNHGTASGGGTSYADKEVTTIGDLKFPRESLLPGHAITLNFLDACLKDGPRFQQASAKVYITGSNRWVDLPTYPPPDAKVQPLYIHSGGHANTKEGDGTLSWNMPANEQPDTYAYDPMNPVPSRIPDKPGPPGNPVDSIALESRPDVLVYTSEALTKPLTIIGDVVLELHAASDARDTDFTGNILDVYPDGRAIKLGPKVGGIMRARFRNGYDHEELLTPGAPAVFKIDLFDIGHTFLPGHRIRVEVSSSMYPWISANPNTGNPIATDTETPRVAHQRILHEAMHASRVLMPVLPNLSQSKGD